MTKDIFAVFLTIILVNLTDLHSDNSHATSDEFFHASITVYFRAHEQFSRNNRLRHNVVLDVVHVPVSIFCIIIYFNRKSM